jgi:hypothetical protein
MYGRNAPASDIPKGFRQDDAPQASDRQSGFSRGENGFPVLASEMLNKGN